MNRRMPTRGGWSLAALLRDGIVAWRLLRDPAVPGLLKLLLPGLALLYMIWPVDLMPMLPFDDIAVALLATRLFVTLAPRASVERAVYGETPPPRRPASSRREEPEVIDTTWRVIKD
jgi:uncharacterized membrane protein YkvA (DUF1232 family)